MFAVLLVCGALAVTDAFDAKSVEYFNKILRRAAKEHPMSYLKPLKFRMGGKEEIEADLNVLGADGFSNLHATKCSMGCKAQEPYNEDHGNVITCSVPLTPIKIHSTGVVKRMRSKKPKQTVSIESAVAAGSALVVHVYGYTGKTADSLDVHIPKLEVEAGDIHDLRLEEELAAKFKEKLQTGIEDRLKSVFLSSGGFRLQLDEAPKFYEMP